MTQELYLTHKIENYMRYITGVYTKPPSHTAKYKTANVNIADIPYLRITRKSSYGSGLTKLETAEIKYLHSIGEALDYHPEIGSEYPDNAADWLNYRTHRYGLKYEYEYLRVIKEPTTHIFRQPIDSTEPLENPSIVFEKVSSIPIELDKHTETGFFIEYPVKLYGLLLKEALYCEYRRQQPDIVAFSSDTAKLQDLDVSQSINIYKSQHDYETQEILVIGWVGDEKPNHKFYGISDEYGCMGVLYTEDPIKYQGQYPNNTMSLNRIEMNVFYDEGILNN